MNNYALLAPEIFLVLATAVVRLVDVFFLSNRRVLNLHLSLVALLGTFVFLWQQSGTEGSLFNGAFVVDQLATTLKLWIVLIVAGVLAYSTAYLRDRDILKGEYYDLATTGLLGMMIMVSSGSMLVAYLGLEMLSLSLYAMVAFNRDSARCSEAAIKYFVLGAIASGMLLYGVSMIYGISGELKFDAIAASLESDKKDNVALLLGLACVVVGLAFKLGAVPFHMWVPDVYDGAPTVVTLYISSAPKIAGFALAIRFLADGLQVLQADWQGMLVILAVLSLAVGNVIAIAQTNIKRMLAYSTISHVGFLMLGLLAGTSEGYASAMFYAITYAVTSLGGFGVLLLMSRRGFEADQLDDLKGLFRRSPWFALTMMVLLLSMAGVPPTVGFYAKLSVLKSVVAIDLVWLALYAVVFSIIGAYYYLRAIKVIFFDQPEEIHNLDDGLALRAILSVNGLAVLGLGIFPGALMAACIAAFGG
ncbi:MAG: NADH-quinone oxidoreductase subunit NuoN [Pseudomonadota bacterium]